jgi:hypothetical protein
MPAGAPAGWLRMTAPTSHIPSRSLLARVLCKPLAENRQ